MVLGRDCAGVVLEVGSSVTRLDVGDEVSFIKRLFYNFS